MIKQLLQRVHGLEVAVSATTRGQRAGEQSGREYWFLTPEEFERRVQAGDFLEYVTYVSGHRYGTLRSEVDRISANGATCLLELETDGALRVRREVPGAVTVFISAPPSELERRLNERATESEGEIGHRVELAHKQLAQASEFDYVIENDEVDRASEELAELVEQLLLPSNDRDPSPHR